MDKLNHPRIFQFTVTTAALKLLDNKKNRKAVLIYNAGAAPVELLSSAKAPYGTGIPIPAGSCYENDHFNCQGEYYVVCSSGTVDIRVEEDIQSAESKKG